MIPRLAVGCDDFQWPAIISKAMRFLGEGRVPWVSARGDAMHFLPMTVCQFQPAVKRNTTESWASRRERARYDSKRIGKNLRGRSK